MYLKNGKGNKTNKYAVGEFEWNISHGAEQVKRNDGKRWVDGWERQTLPCVVDTRELPEHVREVLVNSSKRASC